MANLIYVANTSLDGYTEDKDGKFDWTEPSEEYFRFITNLVRATRTHLYGRRMYESMQCWLELIKVENDRVQFLGHNLFKSTGEDVVASSELRFRHKAEVVSSLMNAGFTIEHVYGNWHREPFTETSRLMIFAARRN